MDDTNSRIGGQGAPQENNRILVVDDNRSIHEDFRKILCPTHSAALSVLEELENGLFDEAQTSTAPDEDVCYAVDSAYQGQEALDKVIEASAAGQPYALVFMDVRMPPGWDGIETISRIWEQHPYIEMVICTAYSDYAWDDIIKRLGKTDRLLFATKPFDAITVKQMALTLTKKWNLGTQARYYIAHLETEVNERTTQLRILLEELNRKNQDLLDVNRLLEQAALHDVLTELPNRALFSDRLEHALKISRRDRQPCGILIMDVNKFKDINDTAGHPVGDAVLREISKRLLTTIRASDTCARLGGDEFAIILRDVNATGATTVAEKIQSTLTLPVLVDGRAIHVGLSIGIAIFPLNGEDAIEMVRHADTAMYHAKQNGLGFALFDVTHNALNKPA